MTARLRSEFMLDADIRSGNYTIETENGAVYLIGSARSQAELDRATRIARYIPGVQRVSLMLSCALAPRLPNNRCSRSLPPGGALIVSLRIEIHRERGMAYESVRPRSGRSVCHSGRAPTASITSSISSRSAGAGWPLRMSR